MMRFKLYLLLLFVLTAICSCKIDGKRDALEKELQLYERSAEDVKRETDSIVKEIDKMKKWLLDSSFDMTDSIPLLE